MQQWARQRRWDAPCLRGYLARSYGMRPVRHIDRSQGAFATLRVGRSVLSGRHVLRSSHVRTGA
jgi:hypothetical protein